MQRRWRRHTRKGYTSTRHVHAQYFPATMATSSEEEGLSCGNPCNTAQIDNLCAHGLRL